MEIDSFVLFAMSGLWAMMWIICWKHCLVGSIESFLVWLLFTIIWLHIYHQYVTAIELKAQLEYLKIYFDEKEDTTLPDITEKVRKLPIYFSQVTTLLKVSLVLLAKNAVIEQSTITLFRTKNWLQTLMTQGRLNYCILLPIYK